MVSRDTRVHLAVVGLTVALLIVVQLLAAQVGVDLPELLLFAVFYGLVFGGAHLYLAVRDDGGLVPPRSRWRYVGVLAALLLVGTATAIANGGRSVAGLELRTVAWVLAGLLIAGYFLTEARDGYRSTRAQ